jgi:glutamine amidotransferase
MCRLAAYSGPPLPLAALTHTPAHSLVVQSYKPKQMREALLNADGVGAVWYPDDGDPRPCRYRSHEPIWSDENLEQLAPRIRSSLLMAIIRSATPGLPVGPASTPPYIHGPIAFMHNGYLEGFRKNFMRPLRERISDESYEVIVGATDTEHIFAAFLDALRGKDFASTESLVEAMRSTLALCTEIATNVGARAVLNIVASNGKAFVATHYSSSGLTASLWMADRARGYDEGFLVASEPLTEDPKWVEVPVDTMVVVEGGRAETVRVR